MRVDSDKNKGKKLERIIKVLALFAHINYHISHIQKKLDIDRIFSRVITISCFVVIASVGFWVYFYPESEAIDVSSYATESKRNISYNEEFGWKMAADIIEGTSISLSGVLTSYYHNDSLLWDLKTDQMTNGDVPGSMKCTMTRLVDYQHSLGETEMWAEEAILDTRNRKVLMNGDVNVISKEGYKFYTEKMEWSEKTGRIKTDIEWTLIFPNKGVYQGEGGSFDLEFKNPIFYKLRAAQNKETKPKR